MQVTGFAHPSLAHPSLAPGHGVEDAHAPRVALVQKRLPHCYVITGVSGCGKSTVGKMLAERLKAPFFDGDDFHPQRNIDKMRRGEPLTDGDRTPWLHTLARILETHVEKRAMCVLACSCLKRRYRDVLSGASHAAAHTDDIAFVLLQPSREELRKRVQKRSQQGGHFMPPSLLDSQLAALEVDPSSQVFGALQPEEIVDAIVAARRR